MRPALFVPADVIINSKLADARIAWEVVPRKTDGVHAFRVIITAWPHGHEYDDDVLLCSCSHFI